MAVINTIKRYVFKTDRVCPPEIHFHVSEGMLTDLRFSGGGCPGNARLVSRLLEGRPIAEVLELVAGIECRDGTSCPDQLSSALRAVIEGRLPSADSFLLGEDPVPKDRVGFVGDLDGDPDVLEKIASAAAAAGVSDLICMGNFLGGSLQNAHLRRLKIQALQGAKEWNWVGKGQNPPHGSIDAAERDWLARLPQVMLFHVGGKKCMAFSGDYIQKLPGYSDYEPYALEINMVCGLADFMQDPSVFPALEAMVPQFRADAVIFSQARQWGHWRLGGKEFISIGPAADVSSPSWGLLESSPGALRFTRMTVG